jgi:hypothetical protein
MVQDEATFSMIWGVNDKDRKNGPFRAFAAEYHYIARQPFSRSVLNMTGSGQLAEPTQGHR